MRHVGIPPMHYLAKWRMQVVSGLLYKNANIVSVAAEVGYGSEASFSRAFKKYVGVPPSLRRERMALTGAVSAFCSSGCLLRPQPAARVNGDDR